MAPSAQDPLQVLLAKACYYLEVAVEASGGPTMAGFYENMSPSAQDPIQVLAAKLAYWASQVAGGGGGSGTDYNLEFANVAALPATPADTAKVWTAYFRSGQPTMHWSPTLAAWV